MIKIIKNNPIVKEMVDEGVKKIYDFDKGKCSVESLVLSELIDDILDRDIDINQVLLHYNKKQLVQCKDFLIWLHSLPEEKVIYDNTEDHNFRVKLTVNNEPVFIIGWNLYYLMQQYPVTMQFMDELLNKKRISKLFFVYNEEKDKIETKYEWVAGKYLGGLFHYTDHIFNQYDFVYGGENNIFIHAHTIFLALDDPLFTALNKNTLKELKRLRAFMVFLNHYPHLKMDRDKWASPFKIFYKDGTIYITLGSHACFLMDEFQEVYHRINSLIQYLEEVNEEKRKELISSSKSDWEVRAFHHINEH